MAHDREVGGLRCLEVLAHLAEYCDGELPLELAEKLEAHLRGCDWCERFGGSYSSTVGELRRTLREPAPVDREVQDRLFESLGLEPPGEPED